MTSESHTNGSLEDNLRGAYQRAQSAFSEKLHDCEDSVRHSPTHSMLMAAVAGYLLHLVPLGAMLGGLVRLLAALVRPVMFLYVAAKLFEALKKTPALVEARPEAQSEPIIP